jgi:FkbM family methyltransferase
LQRISNYWVPAIDVRGFKRRRKTLDAYEEGGNGKQITHLLEALHCIAGATDEARETGVAIDGGANVGAYARFMAGVFSHVHAFEPAPDTFECLKRNIDDWHLTDKVTAYPNALSCRAEGVKVGASWGRRSVSRKIIGSGSTPAISIDSLGLTNVMFLKLDVEGYEEKVLTGAFRTIDRCRPFILMEVKEHEEAKAARPFAASELLLSRGYRIIRKIGDPSIDWLYAPV